MPEALCRVRAVSGEAAHALVPALAGLLVACVHAGASVSFMAPLDRARAEAFWSGVADAVGRGERVLLVAEDDTTGEVVGTVQLVLAQPENQPHRADLSKMLVTPTARRRGIGAALMQGAHEAARRAGKSLLVLDTASAEAERLYLRSGWVRVGVVPDYALLPYGRPCDTVFYYRRIA
jgi:GNAT superfamily N-acetyltransferase